MYELRERIANLERLAPAAGIFVVTELFSSAENWRQGEEISGGAIATVGAIAVLRAVFSKEEPDLYHEDGEQEL